MAFRRRRFVRRGRRRRTRYTWLPTDGLFLTANNDFDTANIPWTLTVPNTGAPTVAITRVTFDSPTNQEGGAIDFNTNLGEILNNEYIIRRIVGNCFAEFPPQRNANGDPSLVSAVNLAAGIFIARAEDEATAAGIVRPIGTGTIQQSWNNYGPHAFSTIREPWIWRRQWILGNPAARARNAGQAAANAAVGVTGGAAAVGNFGAEHPSTNTLYSAGSDAHIDQQTMRRVGNDNRLWCVVAAWNTQNINAIQEVGEPALLFGLWDLRVLGALRRARNVGAF